MAFDRDDNLYVCIGGMGLYRITPERKVEKITDETNSKAEKAQYIGEAFEAFSGLLGNLHEESYIYVQDVRAASYGYGGHTQEWRYQRAYRS